jgi:hypothetical protein
MKEKMGVKGKFGLENSYSKHCHVRFHLFCVLIGEIAVLIPHLMFGAPLRSFLAFGYGDDCPAVLFLLEAFRFRKKATF